MNALLEGPITPIQVRPSHYPWISYFRINGMLYIDGAAA